MKALTFNWGHGIFLFYVIFASVLFYAVYRSTKHDNSLVVENYYEYDLAYQGQYDRLQNSANLSEPLLMQWTSSDKHFKLQFPAEITSDISGEIQFYRPDNKSLDWAIPLVVNETNQMPIDLSKTPAGRWTVKVYWEAAEKPYFAERILDIR
ncbi:MAG: FixH family protein [Bacteroidota bacterium]